MRKRILPALLSVVLLSAVIVPAFAEFSLTEPMTLVQETAGDPNKEFVYYMPTAILIDSTGGNVERVDTTVFRCRCGFFVLSCQENAGDIWGNHSEKCHHSTFYWDTTFHKIKLKNGESIKIYTVNSTPAIYVEQANNYLLSYSADGNNFTNFKNDESILLSETMMPVIKFTSSKNGTFTIRRTTPGGTVASSQPVPPVTAKPTNDALWVDGKLQNATVYKIDGSNYFKIRDLAAVLNGTGKQFSVGYDAASKSVTATTGQAYTPVGGELSGAAPSNQTATVSGDTIIVNGAVAQGVTVYKIAGNNYFKLRDLGDALGFDVDYEAGQGMIINTED